VKAIQEMKNGVTTDLYEIQDLNCPVCGKVLTSDEYNHAIEEISLKVGQITKNRSSGREVNTKTVFCLL
jgi:hypothetical protein